MSSSPMPSPIGDNTYFTTLQEGSWLSEAEGQLNVDVIETDKHVIVRTAVAGVRSEEIDVSVTQDTVTIRGARQKTANAWERHGIVHVQECHWGKFSRSIVLPCHIRPDEAEAVLKDGILTITLQKIRADNRVTIIDETEW